MPCSSTLSRVPAEHGAHWGDLAAPQAVNNVMSECLSHLQGEEKKVLFKKKKKTNTPCHSNPLQIHRQGALSLSADAI